MNNNDLNNELDPPLDLSCADRRGECNDTDEQTMERIYCGVMDLSVINLSQCRYTKENTSSDFLGICYYQI